MATTTAERPTQEVGSEPPPTNKRWRWWSLLIPVILAPSLVWIHGAWIDSFEPILVGNGIFSLDVSGPRDKDVRRIPTFAPEGPTEVVIIPFQKGGSMRMVFPILHQGGPKVRIAEIDYGPSPTQFVTVLKPTGLELGSQRTHNPVRTTRPFEPFELREGGNPVIGLNYDFVCQRPGNGTQIIETFRLRFEVFLGTKWVELPLPWRLVLESPTKEDCPPGSAVFGS